MKTPLTCIVLTYNEEKNIRRCLESVYGWAEEIIVVDSFSTDSTVSIAREFTDKVFQHEFSTHTRQWNWVFSNLDISCDWCLVLDADQHLSLGLCEEISSNLKKQEPGINGYYLIRKEIFLGKWIRFGGYYPKYLLKLFKPSLATCDESELVDHRFYVSGQTRKLKAYFIEENKKEETIDFWLEKHLRYAALKAEEIIERNKGARWLTRPSLFGNPDQRTLWLTDVYNGLPLCIRPALYFCWRYFFLLGFLDGRIGFLFHFLQGFWYRQMIDLNIRRIKREAG